MDTILKWFSARPLRIMGGFLVFISTSLLFFFILLDIVVGFGNPYVGIIVYLILPAILILGLLLVPFDSWIQRRRIAKGKPPYPVIDLTDPRQRRVAGFFMISGIVVLMIMTVVSYRAVEYMDTKTFCGTTCHWLMIPEYTAYRQSPHANVACVDCHIGPGATWFVRSKLSGVPQVWHYVVGDYPRPVPTPVKALRPSRDTCEQCHWPEQFYGDMLNTTITYLPDQNNTRKTSTMTMYIGSGGVPGSGIHSHIVSRVYYLPATEKRADIVWVRVERPDHTSQEFINPAFKSKLSKIRKSQAQRLMDCVDCHNRTAHDFLSYETNLDNAITRQKIDPTLPFIKREALAAVNHPEKLPTLHQQTQTLQRIQEITRYYQQQISQISRNRPGEIKRSVHGIRDAYLSTYFPHMRVGPSTYPNWRTHDGCFRCHGTLTAASASGRDRIIPADCNLCHKT